MFKPSLVGIGYVATGLVILAAFRFIMDINLSPAVTTGVMAGIVVCASQHAYDLGKKDRASATQKVEQDSTTEGEES